MQLLRGLSTLYADRTLAFDGFSCEEMDSMFLTFGRNILSRAHTEVFRRGLEIQVSGRSEIPKNRQVLIASNHASHLDYGVLRVALHDRVIGMSALAAADYFFDRRWKRRLLLPLTDLIPVMRQGSLGLALKGAESAIAEGRSILIFPEGTRSLDGHVQSFRPGIGYLQRRSQLPILPIYVEGTIDILPKGKTLPKGRNINVRIGTLIEDRTLESLTQSMRPSEAYVAVAEHVRQRIMALSEGH